MKISASFSGSTTKNTMTPFQQISAMNEAFGNPKGDPHNVDLDRVRSQCLNIIDEFGELMMALGCANPKSLRSAIKLVKVLASETGRQYTVDYLAVRDALCDLQVFAQGGQHFIGVDGDADMKAVVDGVMTRFIKNAEDKEATIALHAAKGVTEVYFEGEYPTMVMKSAVDQPDAPKGKFLKSASYKETVFSPIK